MLFSRPILIAFALVLATSVSTPRPAMADDSGGFTAKLQALWQKLGGKRLPDGIAASNAQGEAMLAGAITACERYYPALQFVVWAGKSAPDAMSAAMFDTEGEA